MSGLVIRHGLPSELVAISPETMERARQLVVVSAIEVASMQQLRQAESIVVEIAALLSAVQAERMHVTRQLDELKKCIMSAAANAVDPLDKAKRELASRIAAYRRELERSRREAEERARREAELRADEERRRLEAEAAKRAAAVAAEAALFGDSAPEPEPPPIVVPVVREDALPPPLPKSPVRTSTRQRLVIDQPELVPIEVANVVVRPPDSKAIEKLLRAGIKVPGCRLEAVEVVGVRSR